MRNPIHNLLAVMRYVRIYARLNEARDFLTVLLAGE